MPVNYITDKEINLDKDDLLGAKPYAQTLENIISTSRTPLTIGLFGGWGVGKSSIIKTIKEKYNNNRKSKIRVFTYDAWKYSTDSFRRTFLYELRNAFNLKTSDQFRSFYEDRNEDVAHKVEIKKYSWIWWIMFSPLLLFLVWLFPIDTDLKTVTSIISLIITILAVLLKETLINYKISVTKPKMFAPEQFENIFDEVVAEITRQENNAKKWITGFFNNKKNCAEKLVIVIDNIDRCHQKLAFELLLTIKNFLEKESVIFVIPIDENEIKKHITEQGNDPNEFLRKLFNTSISVKQISEGDLFDFARKINDKYSLGLSVDIISIVSQKFSKNPRKIIQFLNVYQTEVLLAQFQEENEIIPKGTIMENLTFYAKLLIIREEWSDVYKLLRMFPYTLNDIYQHAINGTLYGQYNFTEEQINFFRRTEHIIPNHNYFELFFNNKDSFREIPDSTNMFVESRDVENIKEQITNGELTVEKLIEFIDSRFEVALSRGEIKTTVVNLISLIFQLSCDEMFKSQFLSVLTGDSKFLGGIKNFINSEEFDEIVLDVEEHSMLMFIKEHKSVFKKLKNKIIKQLKENKNTKNLLIKYLDVFKGFPEEYSKISKPFSDYLESDQNFIEKVEGYLNPDSIKVLFEESLIDAFIDEINKDVNDKKSSSKAKLLSIYHANIGLTETQLDKYVTKLSEFIKSTNDYLILPHWLSEIRKFLPYVNDEELLSKTVNPINNKFQWFWDTFNSSWSNDDYMRSLFVLLDVGLIMHINENSNVNQQAMVISWYTNFFSRNESNNLLLRINDCFYHIVDSYLPYNWQFSNIVINKYNEVEKWKVKKELARTINLMLEKTNEEGLSQKQVVKTYKFYIDSLDDENHNAILEWISKSLKSDLTVQSFNQVVNALNQEEKIEILNILKQLKNNNLIEKIVYEALESAECNKLENILTNIDNSGVSKVIIRKCIKRVLNDIDKSNPKFNCFIEFFANNELSDQGIHNVIAEKIKHQIVSNNLDEVLFALKILNLITINDKVRKSAVRTLILDINKENLSEEQNDLLEVVKKKMK